MHPLFYHTFTTPLTGPLDYLESMQRVFIQDRNSGMIWLDLPDGRQACLLYLGGEMIGVYAVEQGGSRKLDDHQIAEYWLAGDAQITSLELSMLGLRLALLHLEAGSPVLEWQVVGHELPAVFERGRAEKMDGLLLVDMPQVGAYVMLRHGEPLSVESLIVTYGGLQSGALNPRQGVEQPEAACRLALYQRRLDTPAWEAFFLRQAVITWANLALGRYQQLVGANLLNTLDYELNISLRLKRLNIHLVGAALVDQHLFTRSAAAVGAYGFLFSNLVQQTTRVIGKELAVRTLEEAYLKVPENDRRLLKRHNLLPVRVEA